MYQYSISASITINNNKFASAPASFHRLVLVAHLSSKFEEDEREKNKTKTKCNSNAATGNWPWIWTWILDMWIDG
jgi:hypothetical protein